MDSCFINLIIINLMINFDIMLIKVTINYNYQHQKVTDLDIIIITIIKDYMVIIN